MKISLIYRKQANANIDKEDTGFVIPQNSGLRPVSPPKEFADGGGFGSFGSGLSKINPKMRV